MVGWYIQCVVGWWIGVGQHVSLVWGPGMLWSILVCVLNGGVGDMWGLFGFIVGWGV